MNISILCTDERHPVVARLRCWAAEMTRRDHVVTLVHDRAALGEGDILFLVSCGQILREAERNRFKTTLVLHASDLPAGRGWSPHIWGILEGKSRITVCLLEAADPVDSGAIWKKVAFDLDGHELLPEINGKLFDAEVELMTCAVEQFDSIVPVPQPGGASACYARRTPADSRLDPRRTIAEQFELLRVVDSVRYPAYFDYRGHRYVLRIEKVTDEQS